MKIPYSRSFYFVLCRSALYYSASPATQLLRRGHYSSNTKLRSNTSYSNCLGEVRELFKLELHVDCSNVSDLSCLEASCSTCALDDIFGCSNDSDESACSYGSPEEVCLHCIRNLVCV